MVSKQLEAVLQPMNYDDLEACWALDQRCFIAGEAFDQDMIAYLLLHENKVCYKLINVSEELIGFIIGVIKEEGTGHIITLAIAPEMRGRGYGRWLMERIESGFRLRNVTTLHLEVRTTNKQAQHLYTKLGYFIVERIKAYYSDGGDAFMMVKSILDLSPEE
ncbi:MAG: ribosomal protein S18-alanine N-acetyltransferase [Blastocatellia bacterium]|nr:ribosomal protein S18-alanine N-acetyltransferase [Blastocatellia bacterium]MBN8725812.1 ribosomal protein S18-alanine N-acetyltransferase [Acidobacteriota bacterium]